MTTQNNNQEEKRLAEIRELLSGDYETVEGIEVLNQFANTHKIKFDDKSFDEIIKNFNEYKSLMCPNLAMSHSDQQVILKELFKIKNLPDGEELPNLGFVERLYKKGKSLYADFIKVPAALKEFLFGGKFFKSISPELVWNYRDTGKKVMTSVRLTNNPSQKHIYDVHMGEASRSEALRYDGNPIIKEVTNMSDPKIEPEVKDDQGIGSKLAEKLNSFMDSFKKEKKEEVKPVITEGGQETVSLSDFNDMKSEMNALKLQLLEKDAEQKNFSEQIIAVQNNARLEKANAICKQALLDGVPPTIIDQLKPVLLSDIGESTVKFSAIVDDEKVEAEKSLIQIVQDVFKNYPSKISLSNKFNDDYSVTELKEHGDDKMSKINKRVTELKAGGMSEFEALDQAGNELL